MRAERWYSDENDVRGLRWRFTDSQPFTNTVQRENGKPVLKGRGRLRLGIGPPLKSSRDWPATINFNSLISKNNKSDLPRTSIPWKITLFSFRNLSQVHFSETLCMSKDDACPLWKSIKPMQLCTLYNFAGSTAVLRGGRHGRLGRTELKNYGSQAARDFCSVIHIYSR